MARRMYRDDGSWVDYAPEGEVVNRSGNWGAAGYDPDGRPVNLGGQDYYRVGMPWGNGGRFDGQTYQGRPYSDFTRTDPTYGMLARGDALKDASRLNPSHWTDFGPALFAGGMFAGPIAASLSSLGGLGASLGTAHGGAAELAGLTSGLGGAGAGTGAGFEVLGGGAGGPLSASSGGSFLGGGALPSVMDAGYGLGSLTAAPGAGGAALTSAMSSAPSFLGGAGALPSVMDAPALFGMPGVTAASAGFGLPNIPQQQTPAPVEARVPGQGGVNVPNTGGIPNPVTNPVVQGGLSAALSRILRGEGTPEDYLSALGVGGSTLMGVLGSRNIAGAANDAAGLQRQIYEREAANRQPFVDNARNLLLNPDDYYKSAPALGAAEAATRKLSAEVGNPALNPGAISRLAAYNLGGYNDALTRALSGAGLASAGTLANIGQSAGQAGIQGAQASGDIYNALGYGLRQLSNPYDNILRQFGVVT